MAGFANRAAVTVRELDTDDAAGVADFYQRILLPHFRADELVRRESFAARLMVFEGTEVLPGTRQVDGQLVESVLTEYLESCEGQVRPDGEEAQRLLAACRRHDGLPLLLSEEPSGEEPQGEPT